MLFKNQINTSFLLLCISVNFVSAAEKVEEKNIDEIIVLSSHLDLQRQQMGGAMTILTSQDIDNIGSPYLSDVLRHVPGLAVSRTGAAGGLTQVRVRGSEANHVLVVIDGIEANSMQGEYDFSQLTTDNIERIEVLRGAQSGVFGSNATAGVINIVTSGVNQKNSLTLALESGSLNFQRQSLQASSGDERVQGGISLSHQRFKFNAAESGNEEDLDENYTGTLKGSWRVTNALSLFANGRYVNRQTDTDAQPADVAVDAAGFSHSKETSALIGASLASFDDTWLNKITVDSSRYNNGAVGSFGPAGDTSEREKIVLQSQLDFDQQGIVKQRATVLFENEREGYRNNYPSDISQIPEQSRRLKSAGLEYFVSIQQSLNLSAAIRSDNNDRFENANTYHLAGRWLYSDAGSLHASTGTGVTNPSFFEQFGYFPGFYTGNPGLEPEQLKSWDIGWEHAWINNQLTTDITYFDLNLEKEIAGFNSPFNLNTDSERTGVELSVGLQLLNGFVLNGSYTHTDTTEDGQQELRRPKNTASLDGSYGFINNKLNLNVGVVYNGTMIDTNFATFSRASIDSYTLVNASINYQVNDRANCYIRVNNLLDEDYQEVIGFASPGIYGSAGIKLSF